MDINEARQSMDDYLRQKPHYSGEIEKSNNGFQITLFKHSYSKPLPIRNNEEVEIRVRTIPNQVFRCLTRERLHEIIEKLMNTFIQN
ncbi:hypothetical protein [Legionella erythra]|uniref:Uncharacterized protein n=1 Tax=Legionella erythra TaxID=448 RepID=A0A0W0TES1_LEGER|nr:hypothetical protein [Legionella erythra]KTC94066.1 hypothetical protein Lery_2233 [Legionella erythra]